eukprot:XP_001710076.1 Hypothetical protein GL50803_37931 [Giardia lamblia ATCC 50803]
MLNIYNISETYKLKKKLVGLVSNGWTGVSLHRV